MWIKTEKMSTYRSSSEYYSARNCKDRLQIDMKIKRSLYLRPYWYYFQALESSVFEIHQYERPDE